MSQAVTAVLAGYVAVDVAMGLVLMQKNRDLFDQLLRFFRSGEVVLPLVVGLLAGVAVWYVIGELQDDS